jgi:hypothetical protein
MLQLVVVAGVVVLMCDGPDKSSKPKPNISLDIQLQDKILLQDKGQLANVRKEEEREASEFYRMRHNTGNH